MQLQIVARKLELTTSQREIVTRRLGFALGRFGDRVRRVSVCFTDVNGPRGGVDTTCRIVAGIVPSGEVRVEVTDVGVEAVVSRAAERISRRVSSELERRRTTRGVRASACADGIGAEYEWRTDRMELERLHEHIRTLATLAESDAEVVSCYLALGKGQLTNRNAFDQQVRSLKLGLTGTGRSNFEMALERIEAFLKTGLLSDTKGIALFSRAGEEPFFLPLPFQVPLPNWVAADTTPNIYHLVELKDTYHRYVVMISTEENVRILEVNLGAVTEELWKERPELRKRVGREWTKNHYQNHRRARTEKFIKEKINILDRLMSAGGYAHLILAGDPRMTARVRDQLPNHLRTKLVDVVPAAGRTPVADVVEATIASFIEQEENESRLAVDELVRAVHTGGLAAIETEPVFRALERGQTDTLILAKAYEPDKGWQCTVCDTMDVHRENPEKCPQCGAGEWRGFDVKEEMVRLAEREGCAIEVVEHSDKLMLLGGVGCLLRYRLPEEYFYETTD